MTSWAANLSRSDRQWTVFLMIEGVGPGLSAAQLAAAGGDGRYRFCSFAPAYASAQPAGLWQPLLTEFPQILAERVDPVGGATGSATWSSRYWTRRTC